MVEDGKSLATPQGVARDYFSLGFRVLTIMSNSTKADAEASWSSGFLCRVSRFK